jgi:hypothetical protein
MARYIPASVRRVHVSDMAVAAPSEFARRKQTQPDRVSTVEAVGMALEALGEAPACREQLRAALRLQVEMDPNMRCAQLPNVGSFLKAAS